MVSSVNCASYLRGNPFSAHADTPYPRVDLDDTRLTVDIRAAAKTPATVRLEFVGDAASVDIVYTTSTADLGMRGESAGVTFSAWSNGTQLASQPAVLGKGVVRLPSGSDVTTVYLPEGMRPTIVDLSPVGGTLAPSPAAPRWLAYGDSITEGWGASAPAFGWLAIAGRSQGLDVVNLGFAGSARGELAIAEMIASLPCDVISIAFGTNCWARVPFTEPLLRATLRTFVAVLRTGHPDVPIVLASPVVRPGAEEVTNAVGVTHSALRRAFEVESEELAADDPCIHLVRGGDLLEPSHLADGVHPNDAGHHILAKIMGSSVASQLSIAARENSPCVGPV
jgi:lysophospholipase L1-like esterase